MTVLIRKRPRRELRGARPAREVSQFPGGSSTVGVAGHPDSFGGSGCRGGWGGGGPDVLDPNGPWGDGVRGDHESIRPCCMALFPGPRTRRPVDPAVACPGAPTPAPSPWPVRLLGPRALLLDPHLTRIRGLRRRLRLLPARLTHRRAKHGRGAARCGGGCGDRDCRCAWVRALWLLLA
jgi:hypothetical protein